MAFGRRASACPDAVSRADRTNSERPSGSNSTTIRPIWFRARRCSRSSPRSKGFRPKWRWRLLKSETAMTTDPVLAYAGPESRALFDVLVILFGGDAATSCAACLETSTPRRARPAPRLPMPGQCSGSPITATSGANRIRAVHRARDRPTPAPPRHQARAHLGQLQHGQAPPRGGRGRDRTARRLRPTRLRPGLRNMTRITITSKDAERIAKSFLRPDRAARAGPDSPQGRQRGRLKGAEANPLARWRRVWDQCGGVERSRKGGVAGLHQPGLSAPVRVENSDSEAEGEAPQSHDSQRGKKSLGHRHAG